MHTTMKKTLLVLLLLSVGLSVINAQKIKTKRKIINSGYNYELAAVETLSDGVRTNLEYDLAGTNDKYPSNTEYYTICKAGVEGVRQYVDSAVNFVQMNEAGKSAIFMNTQFVVRPNNTMVVVVTTDNLHMFNLDQLKKVQNALIKELQPKN